VYDKQSRAGRSTLHELFLIPQLEGERTKVLEKNSLNPHIWKNDTSPPHKDADVNTCHATPAS
jgi:hypothetical protein